MAARLAEFGHEMLFYENIEGGHGGAADNAQAAYNIALAYAFVRRALMREVA
jgi:prolyl oligopeptidase